MPIEFIGMKWSLIWVASSLLAGTAFAQAPATPAPPAAASARLDRHHIREVQRTLAALGLDPGPADGVMGPRTKAALTRFQQGERLAPTGTLDAETRSKLAARRREHVSQVQQALKETGHDPGPADGVMGSRTMTALRRYTAAPAPSPPTPSSQLIERFRQIYEPGLQQSP